MRMMLLSMPFFDGCLRRCMKQATEVFNDWAHRGKDEGMERGHSPAVNEMLDVAFQRVNQGNQSFSFADLGCGNGWVVRLVGRHENCVQADGFDGAPHMIEKEKTLIRTWLSSCSVPRYTASSTIRSHSFNGIHLLSP